MSLLSSFSPSPFLFGRDAGQSPNTAPDIFSQWCQAVEFHNKGKVAHVAIDLEACFCDPESCGGNRDTHDVAERVADVAPVLKLAGISNYWVHCAGTIDFYLVEPEGDDTIISKSSGSAFESGELDTCLRDAGIRTIMVSGVYYSLCIYDSVMDARNLGYDVVVLSDLSADGDMPLFMSRNGSTQKMINAGAVFAPSSEVLNYLNL